MKVKEAIEFLKSERDDYGYPVIRENYDQVITLLQQDEAYRKIWNKFKKNSGHFLLGVVDNGNIGEGFTIKTLMNILEKEVKSNGS